MNFKVAAKAIVQKDDKILALQRSGIDGVWDIPGGGIEFGEHPIDALHREVFEETGLKVEVENIFRAWTFFEKEDLQTVGITYVTRYVSGEVKLSDEHQKYEWMSPEKFITLNAYEGLLQEIREYFGKKEKL